MQNGWYKLTNSDEKWTDFWPENDQYVFVKDDMIIETRDEFNRFVHKIKQKVTPEIGKEMVLLDFDGLGVS